MGNCFHCLPSRWNDFQDEHEEILEQLESFRTTFALSNNTTTNKNNCDSSNSPPAATTDGVTAASAQTHSGDAKSSTPRPADTDESARSGSPRQQEQQQRVTGGVEGDVPRGGGGGGEEASKVARPISGREGRSIRSSNAPPRPASGRSIVARTSSSAEGDAGDCGNRSRNHGWGGTVQSPREDGSTKPASNPSSRRSSPRRPPSSGASVPSPRYCSSPRTSRSGSTAAALDADGLRRRRNTDEWVGGEGWERAREGCDEDGNKEEKENQGQRRGYSGEQAVGSTAATVATAVATGNRSGLLHGGDSGGYEDDFDDCFEDESEEGGQQKEQDVSPARGSSGGGGGDKTICARTTPLVEVVYRPPSGGSRGKGERPKSAARQGRSASLNGAG